MLRVRYETACRVHPESFSWKAFRSRRRGSFGVFEEPGIQIRSRQDGSVLGVEALCVGRVAVKNGEFADEHGVDFDGLLSLQKVLHYLKNYGLRLFMEGVDVRSA